MVEDMDRRKFIRSSSTAGVIGAVSSLALLAPSAASASSENAEDALSFVTPEMNAWDVADLVAETDREKRGYVSHVNSFYPDYSAREQLRVVLLRGEGVDSGSPFRPAPLLPAAALAGRALLAAARRYGPRMYNSLKNAVKNGYNAFNDWVKENPAVGTIVGGVPGAALYDWLKNNI